MTIHRVTAAAGVGCSIAVFLAQGGCTSPKLAGSRIPVAKAAQGRFIASTTDLKPDEQPGTKAEMVMAGTHVPVTVSVEKQSSLFRVMLRAHAETFEVEAYRTSPTAFALSEAGGDEYTPELDLVRFPMHVGDDWNWEGIVSSGGIRRKATAVVMSSSTTLYENGVSTEAVRVEVALSLFSDGSKNPAARKLTFDFVPGKGIVRREFGDASVRQPMPQ